MVRITRIPIRLVACSLTISLMFLGCVHTRTIYPETTPESYHELNREIGTKHGSVIVKGSGEVFYGRRIQLTPDETIWHQRRYEEPRVFPNSNIRKLVLHDHSKGLYEGAMYGAVTGAAAGLILGALISTWFDGPVEDCSPPPDSSNGYWRSCDHDDLTVYEGMMYGTLYGALSGAAVGGIFGSVEGSHLSIRYKFPLGRTDTR